MTERNNNNIEQDTPILFYNAENVMNILGVSRATAYKKIKELNEELSNKEYITVTGKVPAKYFRERLYC